MQLVHSHVGDGTEAAGLASWQQTSSTHSHADRSAAATSASPELRVCARVSGSPWPLCRDGHGFMRP